jgi:transposase-like protein
MRTMGNSDHDSGAIAEDAENPRHWTFDEARRVLAAFAASGLTLTAFATREGLQPQRLYKWRRRLSEQAAPLKFAEVPVGRESPTTLATTIAHAGFEVVLRSGRVVRFDARFDATALRRLLSVLEGEPVC